MSLDSELRQEAYDAINENGKSIVYKSIGSASGYDPTTQKPSVGTLAKTQNVKAIVQNFTLRQATQSSGLIAAGDYKILIAAQALQFEPKQGDTMSFDGKTITVPPNGIVTTYGQELPVIYEIQGKR